VNQTEESLAGQKLSSIVKHLLCKVDVHALCHEQEELMPWRECIESMLEYHWRTYVM